jgi:pyrroloquinoline-quinone synthase
MSVVARDHLQAIDEKIESRSLLLHPFYQSWQKGELTIEALRDYARQYYHHVAAFPTYLSAVHAHTDDLGTRRRILANLIDEEAGNPNHPELWLDFAESLGVAPDEARQVERWPETNALISRFRQICGDRSTAEGIAALYAYESQIPRVAESKISGLASHYGINDEAGLAYFKVHIEADREHSAVERELLQSQVNGDNAEAAGVAVDETLEALWEMLSGVCRRHQIEC